MRVGERVLELENVPDVRATEPVDRVGAHDPGGHEVVRVLDVDVIHRCVELHRLYRLHDVVLAGVGEHDHARLHGGGRDERQRVRGPVGTVPETCDAAHLNRCSDPDTEQDVHEVVETAEGRLVSP